MEVTVEFGKASGMSINACWRALLVMNEKRKRKGRKPWTDAEISAMMKKAFPESANKGTTTRVRMYRSFHNTGKFAFAQMGSAKSKGLPISHEYDEKGKVVAPGTRRPKSKKAKLAKRKAKAGRKVKAKNKAGKSKRSAKPKAKTVRKSLKFKRAGKPKTVAAISSAKVEAAAA